MTQCDFICLLAQLRLFHWNTPSYSAHRAYGHAYELLNGLLDDFVESWQGSYGPMPMGDYERHEPLELTDKTLAAFFTYWTDFLLLEVPRQLNADTDKGLLNKRDEILGCLSKLKFLLTLA